MAIFGHNMGKEISSFEKITKEIEESLKVRDFARLDGFLHSKVLEKLDRDHRDRMALLYLERGEESFYEHDLIENPTSYEHLKRAKDAFQKVVKLSPSHIKGWILLAEAHLKMGVLKDDLSALESAKKAFSEAERLSLASQKKLFVKDLWDFGLCLYLIGKHSEEAIDLKQARDRFEEAYTRGLSEPAFLLDYGTVLGELGVLVGREELLVEAVSLLEKSIEQSSDSPSAWLRLACIYKILYFLTGDVVYFEKADAGFVSAARLSAEPLVLWLNWGQLLLLEGKTTKDEELIGDSREKLEKALLLKKTDPYLLACYADAVMHLAILQESFELFKEAEACFLESLKKDPLFPDAICLLGQLYIHLGKYLGDPIHLQKAIDQFRIGISSYPESFHFWHGLATAHFAMGELKNEEKYFERAAKYSGHAVAIGGDLPQIWNDWGIALMKWGEASQESTYIALAVQKFENAITSSGRKSDMPPDPEWFYNLGSCLDWLGDFEMNPEHFERSISVLTKLLEQFPEMIQASYNLGLAYYHLGDTLGEVEPLEKSIELLESVVKRDEEDDAALADLGITYLTLGDILLESASAEKGRSSLERAELFLRKALSLGSVRVNYFLACLHALKGEEEAAIDYLRRAKKGGSLPSYDDLQEDSWLDSIRHTAAFQEFMKGIQPNP